MKKFVPYEHRGKYLSNISITTEEDFKKALKLFKKEDDIWLRKIIALKIINSSTGDISIYEKELKESVKCKIK